MTTRRFQEMLMPVGYEFRGVKIMGFAPVAVYVRREDRRADVVLRIILN